MTDRAIFFADLAGFTALTEAHGDTDAADAASRFEVLARESLEPGAELVKTIGDAVMIVVDSTGAAVATARNLFRRVQAEPNFPGVRAGMHVGPTVERNGDHFGAAVNLAARVAEHARADELLITDRVLQDTGGLPELEVHPLGPLQLRGVRDPVRLFVVADDHGRPGSHADDPVCRMRLDPKLAPARLPYAGEVWFFCSLACARQFADDPGRFVPGEQKRRDQSGQ